MAQTPPALRARRIVVALDASSPGKAALQAVAALASRLQAELFALFVEDIDLLHLAAMPGAREIGYPSAIRRELDVAAMERSLRLHAEDARRLVAALAENAPLKWSFQVARGSLTSQLLSAVAEADLVVAVFAGSEQAALQLAAICEGSASAAFLRARTTREFDELLRELRRRGEP